MPTQTYQNHRHNPRMTGIGFLFVLLAIVTLALRWFRIGGPLMFAVGLASIIGAIVVLLLISRLYTTKLQDRIIRLEMKIRALQLLPPEGQAAMSRIPLPQVVALRFASDEELASLLVRAERENLTPDQIKQAIKTWVADDVRT